MNRTRSFISRFAFGAGILFLGSCGTSPNDQGVSFTAISFNAVDDSGVCELDTGVSGVLFPLTSDDESIVSSGNVYAPCMQIQNNMSSMFVRTERAYLDYYIEGASEQPPSTITAFSFIVGPGSGGGGAGGTGGTADTTTRAVNQEPQGNLPTGAQSIANILVAPIIVVPSEIRSWLALNRGSLPEAPFNMVITAVISGVTSAGDRLESNSLSMNATVTNDLVIPPTDGGTGSGGTGGTGG